MEKSKSRNIGELVSLLNELAEHEDMTPAELVESIKFGDMGKDFPFIKFLLSDDLPIGA